ncbi:MAG: porphobilinogen synthase [Candidatus Riflebacteria bacterium]|nr:porphobilinogen synthase [Candidatus Riflebacteria bacterium]
MSYPTHRPRRLRGDARLRNIVRETRLSPENFIYPLFVEEELKEAVPISAMPGQSRWPVAEIIRPVEEAFAAGVRSFLFFGSPDRKDRTGTAAHASDGCVQRALELIKKRLPEALLITDVCLCAYTDHGHCGVPGPDGTILNDETLPHLCEMALSHVRAGADIVAPSDMMDGRIGAMRATLDIDGFSHIPIMSYAAKFASSFYGPFREAAHSAPQFGDRRTYQMDVANAREALMEMELDFDEGADILMVKPAMTALDILRVARDRFPCPLAAYQVSGEYSMIKAAAANGWLDEKSAMLESLLSIKRAGADLILTYFATEASKALKQS